LTQFRLSLLCAPVRLAALTQHLRWQHADAMRHFTACIALVAQCEVYFKHAAAAGD
jgi:hypothetical protein